MSSVVESPASGDLDAGNTVTLTLNLSEAVTVAGGTPTLTLNDGGTATYSGGSGTNALTFSYTVGAGQNTSALTATAVNLNSASITDGAGNAANLSLSGLTQSGPQIDTTTPATPVIANDIVNGNNSVSLSGTAEANTTVTVYDGSTELGTATANNSGAWSYTTGTLTNGLQAFAATATDAAGNTSATSNVVNLVIGQSAAPTVSSLVDSPSSGDLDAGNTVTLTLNLSEAVTVAGGTPTLTLNDGGTATYSGGSGTNALTFSYTVGAGQNTSGLTATAVNLNSATITDGAGNAANLSFTGLTQSGPQIDTTTPTVSSIVESPASGDLNAGNTVTLTLNLSEAVTVAGGTPTLTLNDGGTATYSGGSGTNALTFSYTVGAGQNTSALTATAVNLNSATVTDGAGNAASLSLSGLTQSGPQIDTTTPVISSIVDSPSSGDLDAGNTVTLTLNLSEAVTVAGGTPTLTLNDGGTATYSSGSGTSALTFSYTVAAGQNTSAVTATAVNLNSASITDGAGNAANLSLSGLTQSGPQIDTTVPAAPVIANDIVNGNNSVSLSGTAGANTTVTVYDGSTEFGTATANDSGAWSYTTGTLGNGNYSVTATDTDAAGNVSTASPTLTVTVGALGTVPSVVPPAPVIATDTINGDTATLNGTAAANSTVTVYDQRSLSIWGAKILLPLVELGTTQANGSGSWSFVTGALASGTYIFSVTTQGTPQIDTTTPVISSIVDLPSSGDLDAGNTVTLTLNLSEAVTVASGTPTLTLNDGGTASYVSGSGTSALTFSYTVAAGQNTSAVTATAVNLNSASITDGAGNAASLSLSGLTQSGPQIDTTVPAAPVIANDIVNGNNSVSLSGTAGANTTVTVYDGSTEFGTATANDSGAWSYTTGTLGNGNYSVTATDTDAAGNVSTASPTLTVTVGALGTVPSVVPPAPVIATDTINGDTATLNGTAAANSTVTVYDQRSLSIWGAKILLPLVELGTTQANGSGSWSFVTGALASGTYIFYATATNAAGTSAYSAGLDPVIGQSAAPNADATTLAVTGTVEITQASSANVAFQPGGPGELVLDQPATFSGTVSGFGAQSTIDLPGIAFDAQTTLGYLPSSNQAGGTLSLTDGSHSASIALLGQYMASSFAVVGDNHGGTMVGVEASQIANQSLLTNPRHT